jgi:hypothetical protein
MSAWQQPKRVPDPERLRSFSTLSVRRATSMLDVDFLSEIDLSNIFPIPAWKSLKKTVMY